MREKKQMNSVTLFKVVFILMEMSWGFSPQLLKVSKQRCSKNVLCFSYWESACIQTIDLAPSIET